MSEATSNRYCLVLEIPENLVHALSQGASHLVKQIVGELGKPETTVSPGTPPSDKAGLVDSNRVAELLAVSPRTVWALTSQGAIPKPVRLGRCVRWLEDEIHAWLRAGCPPRQRWETLRKKAVRG